ncbi:MAG: ureidoglycolate lyase [Paracoccaceae bacterium]|nr:ureidoglycolate lyase [Paracoccaceae bacterium]
MSRVVRTEPLTAQAFALFGDVIEAAGAPARMINRGNCGRFDDLARLDFAGEGRPGISVFKAKPYALPLTLEMVERHPLGSQAFLPLSAEPFLVVVAPDEGAKPGRPRAFLTAPGQGVNYHRGTWHGVLTPLSGPGLFAVVDRLGDGDNLEEHWFETPYIVE